MAADGTLRFDTSLDPEGFQSGSEKLKRSVQSLITTTNKIGQDTQKAFSSFAPTMQTVSRAFEDTREVMLGTDFAKYMTDAQGQVTKLATDITRVGQAINSGFKDQHGIDNMKEKLNQTSEQMQMIEQRMQELSNMKVETQPYADLAEQFARADEQLQKLKDKEANFNDTGVSHKSAKYKNLQQQIEQTELTLKNLKAEMDDMEASGGATISGSETQEYQQLAGTLDIVRNAYNETQSAIDRASSSMAASSMASAVASRGLHGIVSGLGVVASATSSAISSLARLSAAVARVPFQAMAAGARGTATAFRTIGSAIKNAISYFASFRNQGKGVGDLAGELVGRLDSVKRMLVSRVKRMFISAIMRDMQAAMTALAQKSSEFQSALNGMQTAASGLSANLASLFGGIITALAPVVTQIISWISTIISYINALFGLLSGKGTIMTAKKGVDSLGKSAGGGSKKVKELKKELMGFDEINNLKEDEDSGGGGGGGGAGDLFEETSIDDLLPENIRDYFQRIKDAILSENWEEVGGLVADGLNYAMRKIDDAILQFQSVGVKWANIIARVMNGLVARFDFPLLGKTIGDGFNTIIMIENEFLETFEFIALGAGLGDTINAMFATIDWTAVGRNFALKINAFTAVVDGFLTNFKAKTAGADLGTMVNSMFDGIVWTGEGGIASVFSNGVNAVIDALDGFITEVEKGGAERRQKFANAIQQAITGVNWVQAIVTLNQGFKLISLWLSVAFEGLAKGIEDSAPAIVTALNGVIKEENFTPIADSIGNGIKSLVTAFDKITNPQEGIDFEGLGNKIAEGINVIIGKVDFSQLIVAIGNGIIGVSKMFWGFLSLINFDKIATDLLNGINTLITDTSFKDVIDKATQGVDSLIDAFGKLVGTDEGGEGGIKFSDLATKITEGINQIATDIKFDELITAVGTGVGKVFVALAEGFSKVRFDTIARHIARGINGIAHNKEIDWAGFGRNLGTGLKNAIEGITTILLEVDWGTIGNNIGSALSHIDWLGIGSKFIDLLKAGILAAFRLSMGFLNGVFEPLEEEILKVLPEVEYTMEEVKTMFYQNAFGMGVAISDGFAEALTTVGPDNMSAALQLMGHGVSEETMKMLDLTNLDANLQAYMQQTGKTLEEVATELGQNTGDAVGSAIPDAINNALQSGIETIKGTAAEASAAADTSATQTTAGQNATATAETVTSNLSSELTAGEGAVGTSAEGVTNAVDEKLSALPEEEKAHAEEMLTAVELAIIAGTPAAEAATQAAAEAVVNKAAEIMSSDKGAEIASTFMGGITSGIQSQQDMIYSNMATVGTYITAGMAHGIYSTTNVVTNAAVNAAIAAYNAAMRALDAHSPSKLFAQVGKWTMLGWAKGEEDNQSAVLDTISNTAKAMEEEAQNTEFNVSADALVSGLDIAMDRLQSIADVFSSIGDMIANIGELPIPAIATGSVIPYRTRISDGFTDNETSLPSNVLTVDNGYDVMYRAFRSALLDTADDRPIELSINGKKLADWVQKQNRIDSRARGL